MIKSNIFQIIINSIFKDFTMQKISIQKFRSKNLIIDLKFKLSFKMISKRQRLNLKQKYLIQRL